MPLDDIIYRTGVKRKALAVQPTICRFCNRPFLDKYFEETTHRVICPFCGKLNAKVTFNDILSVIIMGLKHDIGTGGQYGYHLTSYKKIVNILKKYYKDDWENRLQEILNDLEITERMFKLWLKNRKAVPLRSL
jgi:hypothetical protein